MQAQAEFKQHCAPLADWNRSMACTHASIQYLRVRLVARVVGWRPTLSSVHLEQACRMHPHYLGSKACHDSG